MIRCNFCMARFADVSELQLFRDGDEWFKGCPNCCTDEYLMDLPEVEDDRDQTLPKMRR